MPFAVAEAAAILVGRRCSHAEWPSARLAMADAGRRDSAHHSPPPAVAALLGQAHHARQPGSIIAVAMQLGQGVAAIAEDVAIRFQGRAGGVSPLVGRGSITRGLTPPARQIKRHSRQQPRRMSRDVGERELALPLRRPASSQREQAGQSAITSPILRHTTTAGASLGQSYRAPAA